MLYKNVIVVLLLGFSLHCCYGQPQPNFFRKDYVYLDASQNFYKIHMTRRTWHDARKKCASEGAALYYPETKVENDAVIKYWNETQRAQNSFNIGISELLAKGVFETVDGKSLSEIYAYWAPGEPNDRDRRTCVEILKNGLLNDIDCNTPLRFLCKKKLASLEWNLLCDIPDKSYIYHESFGRCYKFHLKPKNWGDAYSTCSDEQSYLAVINSQEEADHLMSITEKAPKDRVKGNVVTGQVLLGFHNTFDEEWQSIRGGLLEDTGYNKWADKQPDGEDREKCGAMSYDGLLHDVSCDQKSFFICEHEIGALSNSFDERVDD